MFEEIITEEEIKFNDLEGSIKNIIDKVTIKWYNEYISF